MDKYNKLTFLEDLTKFSKEEINQIILQKGKQKMIFPLVNINKPKTLNSKEDTKNE